MKKNKGRKDMLSVIIKELSSSEDSFVLVVKTIKLFLNYCEILW